MLSKLSQESRITIIGAIIFLSIVAAPQIYAAVEPHIILVMDPAQTTNPFTIQDNTATDVFAIDPAGNIVTGGIGYTRTEYAPLSIDTILTNVARTDTLGLVFGNYTEFPNTDVTTFAEPGAGVYQWTRTITANDLPSGVLDGFDYIAFHPMFSFQFENADTVSRTLNIKYFINDIEIESSVSSSTAVTGNFWYGVAGSLTACCSNPLTTFSDLSWQVEAGDIVQVKYWITTGDTTNPVVLKRMSVYTAPAILEITAQEIAFLNNANFQTYGADAVTIIPDVSDITPGLALLQTRDESPIINSEFATAHFWDYNAIYSASKGDRFIMTGVTKTITNAATERAYVPGFYLGQYIIIS